MTWQNGKELKSFNNITYTYNKDGIRVSKKVNGITTNYMLENSNILFEKTGNDVIYYLRDSNSKLIGLEHNGTTYYYLKNLQGDIVGIIDAENNLIASYTYDSWGNIISIKDSNGLDITEENHIALKNPFRYHSYYYDSDTKLYYLNSRYYNPKWGRFINADENIDTSLDMFSDNTYLYAENNPINRIEIEGMIWFHVAGAAIGAGVGFLANSANNIINKRPWNENWVSATVSGAISGFTSTFGGPTAIAGNYISSLVDNTITGIKEDKSIAEIVTNTIVDGTISSVMKDPIKINKGWYKPKTIKTSFFGNYQKKIQFNNFMNTIKTQNIKKNATAFVNEASEKIKSVGTSIRKKAENHFSKLKFW